MTRRLHPAAPGPAGPVAQEWRGAAGTTRGGFYLVGHCHLRQAIRIFAVERIRELGVLGARFQVPAGFDVHEYLEGAWGIIRGDVVTVKVLFARSVARYIREHLWHPTQRFRPLDDGQGELTLQAADTLEVRRWILGFGHEAEVVTPAALREALRRETEALARSLVPRRLPPAAVPGPPLERRSAAPPGRLRKNIPLSRRPPFPV